jgi:hypothetical protein
MQEVTVQWAPPTDVHRLGGAGKLFVLYLLIVVLISVAKSIRLGAQFWRLKRSSAGAGNLDEKANLLAKSAMGGRSSVDSAYKELGVAEGHLKLLHHANAKFRNLYEMASEETTSVKRLAGLTLLLAVLAMIIDARSTLEEIMKFKLDGIGFLSASAADALIPLEFGLIICALLYLMFHLFEGTLMRRRANWNCFYAGAKSDGPAE